METLVETIDAFKNAVDFYFGHNPANPYWALVALVLRYRDELQIIDEYKDGDGLLIDYGIPFFRDANQPDTRIICHTNDPQRILAILDIFRQNETHVNNGNIFNRTQWERAILLNFASELLKIESAWFKCFFDKCFTILYRRAFAHLRFDEYSQPSELTELVGAVSKHIAPDAKVIYNPFSGVASYAMNLSSKDTLYVGEEINPLIAAIADLRLYAKDITGQIIFGDAINDNDYGADLIVSTPAFGMRIKPEMGSFPMDDVMTNEELVLQKGVRRSLPAVVVVPRAINFRKGGSEKLRIEMLESGCLDMVVNLPEKLFSYTSIPTSLYVLNPNHNHKGSVRFIDGSKEYADLIQYRLRTLDVKSIFDTILNGGCKEKLVSYRELQENQYNFSPEFYFSESVEVPEGYSLMKVSELGTIVKQPTGEKPKFGKLVNFGVLTTANPIKVYTPSDFKPELLPDRPMALVQSGLLFMGGRGNLGICVNAMGEPLYTHSDYINFVPNEDIILSQYLLIQFRGQLVEDQLSGTIIGRMPRDVFQNIRILVPSIDEQRKAIEAYQSELISELGLEVSNLKAQKYQELEQNLSLRKHTLGNLLNVLMPSADILKDFISAQDDAFRKDAVISRRAGLTLNTLVNRLHGGLTRIETLVKQLTNPEPFGEPEEVDLKVFIDGFIARFPQVGFEIIPIKSDIIDESTAEVHRLAPLVSFSKDDLDTVFDNIINNAKKYGFTNADNPYNRVGIKFSLDSAYDKPHVLIQIMNNGAPLANNLKPEKIFEWGVGIGTGLGGWHIRRLVEHFGGKVTVCQYDQIEDNDYTLGYEISLPLILK